MAGKKRRKSLILRLAVFAFIVYIAVTLINLQYQIGRDRAQLAGIDAQYQTLNNKNVELKRSLSENDSQYMANAAQADGYVAPNERVFEDISGN